MTNDHIALIQNPDGTWLSFRRPVHTLYAHELSAVLPLLAEAEQHTRSGFHAVCALTYEASPAFDSALETHPASDLPLASAYIYDRADRLSALEKPDTQFTVGRWLPSVSKQEYDHAVAGIRDYIAAGDTYQVNYTIRMLTNFEGNPYALFYALVQAQQAYNCAFIDTDTHTICCASPELFLQLDATHATSRPMKGTAARGLDYRSDILAAQKLHNSEKDRAENIMIVDMIRNDLGKVANPGSVQVKETFAIEKYPTVLQMTSTVDAEIQVSIPEIMKAIFPCASITGAPKVRTMQIIRELEPTPRGMYTGTIGYMAPSYSSENRYSRFNVAIRTVVIRKDSGEAEYGVGGGIVWDSEGTSEFAECLAKASILTTDIQEFDLLETMLWTPEGGFFLESLHLARLQNSADYFAFSINMQRIGASLNALAESLSGEPRRIRLLLSKDGNIQLEHFNVPEDDPKVWRLAIASEPIDAGSRYHYHKTTYRRMYESAKSTHPECDDVILHNEKGEVTESTIANVVIDKDGGRYTPPISCGVLAGTFRQHLLEKKQIEEMIITLDDLRSADSVHLINSVRKWMPAELS